MGIAQDCLRWQTADMPESLASLPTRNPSSEGCAFGAERKHAEGCPRRMVGGTHPLLRVSAGDGSSGHAYYGIEKAAPPTDVERCLS